MSRTRAPQARSPVVVSAEAACAGGGSLLSATIELTKPRITRMVALTAGVGYVLGIVGQPRPTLVPLAVSIAACLVGTVLSSSGANALNMWWERARDARMQRTCTRPIPVGAMSPATALWAGLIASVLGVGVLLAGCGVAASLVSLVTILIYVLVYTPSKPLTVLNTLIGAVPGALPPMIGWCAAWEVTRNTVWTDALGSRGAAVGWSLFALMFVWQIPHFLAIAWMYREDYAKGGFRMLPSIDPTGRVTAWCTLFGAVLFLPVSLAPFVTMRGMAGGLGVPYAAVAAVAGVVFVVLAARMARSMNTRNSRVVFFASIIHLPVLLAAMVGETLVRMVLA